MFRIISILNLLLVLSYSAFANDWNQWRGQHRDGILKEVSLPSQLPNELALKWKTKTGKGYSSPVIAGETVYLLFRQDEMEIVAGYRLTDGKEIWRQSYPAPFKTNQYAVKFGKGPFSTPIVADGKLYTFGVGGILSCFDSQTGELHWRKDFSEKTLDTSHFFVGTAMSPLIEDGVIYIHAGDEKSGKFFALNIENGEEKWHWEGDRPGYASPVMATIDGVRQLVTLTQTMCVGIAAGSGELLWQIPFISEWKENIISPIILEKTVIYSGVKRGTIAVTVQKRNNKWSTTPLWNNDEISMYMSSPVLVNGILYGFSQYNKGQFFCLDAATGKTHWLSSGRQGQNASIIAAGDWLFGLTTGANLIVFKQGPLAFEIIREYNLAESATWAHPVIIGNRILVKDEDSLASWEIVAQ